MESGRTRAFVRAAKDLAVVADADGRLRKKRLSPHDGALLCSSIATPPTRLQEKKSACLFLVIMLFKIYFKLNTLHL